jgi:hypothetical protein
MFFHDPQGIALGDRRVLAGVTDQDDARKKPIGTG